MTPSRRDDRRSVRVEAVGQQPIPPRSSDLEVDRHQPQPLRNAEAELDQALPLPRLRSRLVDLEDAQPRRDFGPALGEGVQAGAEDDVLLDAAVGLLGDQVFDEAGPGHDRGAERPAWRFGCMSGRRRQSGSGAASCRPIRSSSTCGGASTSTCRARHRAVRTAVLSGCAAVSVIAQPLEAPAASTRGRRGRGPSSTLCPNGCPPTR